jgi:hypothetical protein
MCVQIYPGVSSTMLRHFVCKQIDSEYYLLADLRVQCYTPLWYSYAYLSIPFILLYPIGIPLFFFLMMYMHREHLLEPLYKVQLGFLYAGYRDGYWWYVHARSCDLEEGEEERKCDTSMRALDAQDMDTD